MQRAGSDHNLAVPRDLSHSEKEVSCQSCFLSIRRVTESVDNTRVSHYIVECKFNDSPTVLQQSFSSTKPEDPEGRTAAIRFALSTDSVTAFRDCLLKYKKQIVSELADNYTTTILRAVDSTVSVVAKSCLTVYTGLRQNNLCGLCFTTAICELIDGSLRCISFRNAEKDIESAVRQVKAFLSTPKFRKWVKRTVKQAIYDEEELGTYRLDDVSPGNCKGCGDSVRSKFYKQDCEEFLCSTCLMKERMKIVILRLEEQVVGQTLTMDKLLTEVKPLHMVCYSNICCVCGSDDNEYLDDLACCPCGNSQAVVHSNCAAACKSSNIVDTNSNMSCIICGCNGSISYSEDTSQQTITIPRIPTVETGVKRLPICNTNGTSTGQLEPPVKLAKVESNGSNVLMESKDMSGKGSARLGRRFNDTPAVVPIKKRRIQLPRSPSPPLVEVSSKNRSAPEKSGQDSTRDRDLSALKPDLDSRSINMVQGASLKESECSLAGSPSSISVTETLKQAPTSPKLIPESISSSPKQENPKAFEEYPVMDEPIPNTSSVKHESVGIRSEHSKLEDLSTPKSSSPQERLPTLSMQEPSEIQRSLETDSTIHTVKDPTIYKSSTKINHLPEESNSEEVEDGELVISMENNMDDFGLSSESPEVSSQRVRRPRSHVVADSFEDDRSCWDLNTEMETWDKLTRSDRKNKASDYSCRLRFGECMKMSDFSNESVRRLNTDKKFVEFEHHRVTDCRVIDTISDEDIQREGSCNLEPGNDLETRKLGSDGIQGLQENHDYPSDDKTSTAKISRVGRSVRRNESFVGLQDEENADYGKSDFMDPIDTGLNSRNIFHEEDGCQKVQDATRNSVSCGSKCFSDCSDQGKKQDEDVIEKNSTSGRTRTTGWDQLPEGFDSAEEALRAAREASRRSRGPWSCLNTRGSTSMGHRFASGFDLPRDALNNARTNIQYRDRRLDDPLHSREGFSHLKRMDDSGDDYNSNRGRLSGRGTSGFHSRSRTSEWGLQDSSMSQCGPDRNRMNSGFSSQRQINCTGSTAPRDGGYNASSDSNISRGGNVSSTGRGGIRSTFLSTGRGPPMNSSSGDLDSRSSYASRLGDRGVGSINGTGLTGREYGASSFSSREPEFRRSPSPGRLHSSDRLSMHRNTGLRHDSRIPRSKLSPPSEESFDRTKFYSKHGSPYSKWSNDRREMDFKRPGPRPYGPPTRTSPHVVHGSSLMDERDLQVLAGTRSSPRSPVGREVLDSGSDFLRMRRSADGRRTRSHSRDDDSKDCDRDSRGNSHRREKDDNRSRDSHRLSGRSVSGHKRGSSRDQDDEVAPRRRRPS